MKKVKGIAIAGETCLNYYYTLSTLRIKAGTRDAFLDQHYYRMEHDSIQTEHDVMVSAEDAEKIYGPDLQVKRSGKLLECRYNEQSVVLELGKKEAKRPDGPCFLLEEEPMERDLVLYIPLCSLMVRGFGKYQVVVDNPRSTNYICISDVDEPVSAEEGFRMELVRNGKKRGDLYGTFWYGSVRKLIPYHAYVPYSYTGDRAFPLVIMTHGGGCDHNDAFLQCDNKIQEEAEKHGFIIWALNGYVVSSWFGGLWPTSSTLYRLDPQKDDPVNPLHVPEEAIKLRKQAEEACKQSIDLAFRSYHIDEKRVYCFGNSMGGAGTFHFTTLYPGLFRAIAPCGGAINPEFFPVEYLSDLRVRIFAGSEDEHDASLLVDTAKILRQKGVQADYYIIGGASHKTGYLKAIPQIFDFFDECGSGTV